MAFLEDPRLRQRWNQISHNAETVTETAAEGIWTFQHRYINPCLGAIGHSLESCTVPCFGDREDRARRARARGRGDYDARAEYTFDFYDDWDDDDEALATGGGGGGGGILGGWGAGGGGSSRGDDWDRLIGGSGASSRKGSLAPEVVDQPRRKRGMSYGTRGGRRKTNEEEDPTIIPSTAPLGFLGRLPWKIGGTLRYKPSAAFLQDHPGAATHPDEHQPLLGYDDDGDTHPAVTAQMRKRSGTAGSGDTSDSYRSRGDLFPSDGEGQEDAIPLDDEFAMNLNRVDDRSSHRTRSSKGKRPASRNVSSTTLSSSTSNSSLRARKSSHGSMQAMESSIHSIIEASLEDLQREEAEAEREEDQEVARKREVATELARKRGLSASETFDTGEAEAWAKSSMLAVDEIPEPQSHGLRQGSEEWDPEEETGSIARDDNRQPHDTPFQGVAAHQVDGAADDFVPARLPSFR
ncbi:hypothetical protein DHEL01_v202835 [Diaporthe helianthi]|uniref:Uncharacterized protein n=1 Tax=Diaporthe helianthi TaxID=158607 RepID=A0A2P5I8D2_DIAHE|nr:hypothetical protein DHEL01_v202835 [Diaporthe helianthi]